MTRAPFRVLHAAMSGVVALILALAPLTVAHASSAAPLLSSGISLLSVDSSYTFTSRNGENWSSVQVIERYSLRFESKRTGTGFRRTIQHADSIYDMRVTNGDFTDADFTLDTTDDAVTVSIDPKAKVSGDREYILMYSIPVTGGMKAWSHDVVDPSWQTPIAALRITLAVPIGAVSQVIEPHCAYSGGSCLLEREGDSSHWSSILHSIGSTETVGLSFSWLQPDTLDSESTSEDEEDDSAGESPYEKYRDAISPDDGVRLVSQLLTAIGALLTCLALLRRIRRKRATHTGRPIIAQYAPPPGLNVMVAAHLLDRPRAAIPAQLLSLTATGEIRFIERRFRRRRSRYSVQLVSDKGGDRHATAMLVAIFGPDLVPDTIRELRKLNRSLVFRMNRVSAIASTQASASGWRAQASLSQFGNFISSMALALFTVATVIISIQSPAAFTPWCFVALGAAAVATCTSILSFTLQGPLTKEGALVRDHLLGLREYLLLAEKDRLRLLQSVTTAERTAASNGALFVELYEKLLPYAVIWGVERSWMQELVSNAADLETMPEWLSNDSTLVSLDFWLRNSRVFSIDASALRPQLMPYSIDEPPSLGFD